MSQTCSILALLVRVLGRRPFVAFFLVSFATVLLLAAVNFSSNRALERYIADQIERVPWDISVYQTADIPLADDVRQAIKQQNGITQVENLTFLRLALPPSLTPLIDDEPLRTPWLSLLTATRERLLPPDIRPRGHAAVLVLVGSRSQMGDAYLQLQHKKRFELRATPDPQQNPSPAAEPKARADHPEYTAGPLTLFGVPLQRVVRIDRNDLNRWFLDKTSSPTLLPQLGAILVVPYDREMIRRYDLAARGIAHHEDDAVDIHITAGDYFPEIIHLAALDRPRLFSGWDVGASLARIGAIGKAIEERLYLITSAAALDNTSVVLLRRMEGIARQIALISLLVSLPLIWMAWILMAHLSGLLLLNERRKFGLLRLRGTPGSLIRASLLLTIAAAGLAGGLAGAVLGTLLPLFSYTDGAGLPWDTLLKVQRPEALGAFLLIGVGMSLVVSLRFVRYASTISPLEASGRMASSESMSTRVRFGWIAALCLIVGSLKIVGWIGGWSLATFSEATWALAFDRALDFISFPLFVYGLATLTASRRRLLLAVLAPTTRLVGGRLGALALRHLATRQHRMAAFLLIVAMMTSLSLYPTIMTAVFDDKIVRGAKVQLGSELQITLDIPSLVDNLRLIEGGMAQRHAAVRAQIDPIVARIRGTPGVAAADYLVEGLVDGLFMPGYGFSGIPIYLVSEPKTYVATAAHEAGLGAGVPFGDLIGRLASGTDEVIVSQAIQGFYRRQPGDRMPVGRNIDRTMQTAPLGGSVLYLPGMPLKTINDRKSFVSARIDYLNHLFGFNSYMAAAADNPLLGHIDALLPRAVLLVRLRDGGQTRDLTNQILAALPSPPLEARELSEEVARLGSDMYIFLARQNFQIYLLGGLLLSIIAILAVALSNYAEDRRTLSLLRIRGCGPAELLRFVAPGMIGPSLVGLLIGALVAAAVGFGLTDVVWKLREVLTVLNLLPTRLAFSGQTALVLALLLVILVVLAYAFSRWIFRRTARESIIER